PARAVRGPPGPPGGSLGSDRGSDVRALPALPPGARRRGPRAALCWRALLLREVAPRRRKTVDISDYIERKIEALCEHVCQMEMTVADLQVQLAASGLDIPLLSEASPKEFRPVIETQIKAWAASVGRRAGFAYGEEFRRVRFSGIERWARGSEAALRDEL